jgi:hypothetical protein
MDKHFSNKKKQMNKTADRSPPKKWGEKEKLRIESGTIRI